MCINPTEIILNRGPNGSKVPVPCKVCWRCKQNRVNGYVGRALCEASTSIATCAITLTYAPRSDLADKVLNPAHFQLFMKRLRRRGHLVRYLVAGEYGSLKGRAHFHALLFFKEFAPDVESSVDWYNPNHILDPYSSRLFSPNLPQMKTTHVSEWPHGHVKVDWSASERAVRYVCKYLLSEDKNNAWFSLSKKPSLGAAFFEKKAKRAIELGVLPSTFEYLPPGGRAGKPYLITGATRRDYLNAITQDPAMKSKMTEWVRKAFEKYERQRWIFELENLTDLEREEADAKRFDDEKDREKLAKLFSALRKADKVSEMLEASEKGYLTREEVGGLWYV